jgi:tight adherence protein C
VFEAVSALAAQVTDPAFLAACLAALAGFMTILTLAAPAIQGGKLAGRLKGVANRREELRRKSRESIQKSQGGLRRESKGFMKEVVEKLNIKTLIEDPNVEAKLLQAGYRGPGPVFTFYFFRFALPIVFFAGALIYLFTINDHNQPPMFRVAMAMGACAIGFYAPTLYITNVGQKRQASIMKAFPDALDLLLICVESGMSIEMAFQRVGQEVGPASIELAEELGLTTAELAYLPDRRVAYENLGKRTNHPGVKAVATALIQAERYGTPLGHALRVMAKENRELRMTEAEKKAAALPAQLTVPMIVFFLPVLFIVILTPAYIRWQNM